MSDIQWSRGLFRLWVIGSIAWSLMISGLHIADISDAYYPGKVYFIDGENVYSNTNYSNFSKALEDRKKNGELLSFDIPKVNYSTLYVKVSTPSEKLNSILEIAGGRAILDESSYKKSRRIEALQSSLIFSFLPPMIFLIVGYALGWVIKGFRSPR